MPRRMSDFSIKSDLSEAGTRVLAQNHPTHLSPISKVIVAVLLTFIGMICVEANQNYSEHLEKIKN